MINSRLAVRLKAHEALKLANYKRIVFFKENEKIISEGGTK